MLLPFYLQDADKVVLVKLLDTEKVVQLKTSG